MNRRILLQPPSLSSRLPLFAAAVLLCMLRATMSSAQRQVAPCSGWLASVDGPSQQIVLRWRPSPDSLAIGYHICTGDTCRAYAMVNGRTDTSYVCSDHSPLSRHLYRVHVFDGDGNVSALTPPFGNIVLSAVIPPCAATVSAQWSPYSGMPSGLGHYALYARISPLQADFVERYRTDSTGLLQTSFDLPPEATHVEVKVGAWNSDSSLVSFSNIVSMQRLTADTATSFGIDRGVADSLSSRVLLSIHTDTAFPNGTYTLWRSANNGPWTSVASFNGPRSALADSDIHPRSDSLYCYRLSVPDACGLNPKFSPPLCVVVPTPPDPAVNVPNTVVAGDPANGIFRPAVAGLAGNLYELTIYDRRGRMVFHSTNPDEGWRPSSSTPQGAYAYSLHARFNDDEVRTLVGTITVIK